MNEYNQTHCDNSPEHHIENIIIALEMGRQVTGLAFGCKDSYRALVEFAEYIRKENNFEPFTVTDHGRVEAAMQSLRQKAQQQLAQAQLAQAEEKLFTQGRDFG